MKTRFVLTAILAAGALVCGCGKEAEVAGGNGNGDGNDTPARHYVTVCAGTETGDASTVGGG